MLEVFLLASLFGKKLAQKMSSLQNATEKVRTSKAHYGMGLFIAKSIAEQRGGTLSIANSAKTGGGEVTIEIPTGC